jgi:thiol-disulfide isomerase/thioredoxin
MVTKKVKKEIRDWAIFASILLTLYLTGLHTDVAAFAQRIVLATGIANPNTEELASKTLADYNFTLDQLDGDQLDFTDLKEKVVFINFWATWCAPCVAEMPSIHALYDIYKDDPYVVFVMLNLDRKEDIKKVRKFIDKKDFTFPIYFPNATQIPKVYESKGIPTTFVLNKEGYIDYKKVGMANYDADNFILYIKRLAK